MPSRLETWLYDRCDKSVAAKHMTRQEAFCLGMTLEYLADNPCGDFAETLLMLLDRDTLTGIGVPERAPLELIKAIVAEQPGITQAKLMGRAMAGGISYHKGLAMIRQECGAGGAFKMEKGSHNQTFYYLADDSSFSEQNGTSLAIVNCVETH